MGATDYLCKSLSPRDLLIRIETILHSHKQENYSDRAGARRRPVKLLFAGPPLENPGRGRRKLQMLETNTGVLA